MDITDQVARMKAALGGLVRRQSDHFATFEQRGQEIRSAAHEKMANKVKAAERYVQHRRELGRRASEAGGWATEKTLSDRNHLMGFGPEDSLEKPGQPESDAAPAAPLSGQPVPPAAQAAPEPPRAVAPRKRRPADSDGFDDDDFSNNSWMVT